VVAVPKTIRDFEEIYGREIISVLESFDGTKSMADIAKEAKIPLETLTFVAEQLVLAGLLQVKEY
jgi:hypothetical protein